MQLTLALLGTALVVALLLDVLVATLSLNGHSVLTRTTAWLVSSAHSVLPGVLRRNVVPMVGAFTLVALFLSWFLLLWMAWSLIFLAGEASVLDSVSRTPADVVSTVYFVGFTIITLGVGDYVPAPGVWQILTIAASVSGFFVVTMVVTYALPVLSAVVQQRKLASAVTGVGGSATDLLRAAWDGERFTRIDCELRTLTDQIQTLEKQHLAYPALHNFLTNDRASALPVAMSALDDFVSAAWLAAPAEQRPAEEVIVPLRRALDSFLQTLNEGFIAPAQAAPPLPAVSAAVADQMPAAFSQLEERRRLLLGWVQQAGHEWPREELSNRDGRSNR